MNLDALVSRLRSPLSEVDRVGSHPVLSGRPWIQNHGRLTIGSDFRFGSTPAQSHLVTSRGAELTIGDRVTISYGAAIAASNRVSIGNDTQIAPYCVIMDSDYHNVGDRSSAPETTPIVIGARVMIGSRVTILRGSTIGDDARLLPGSVVSGAVPAGAVFGGVPARAVTNTAVEPGAGGVELPELVKRVFGLKRVPDLSDGPDTIAEWDSLGSLRLLLALEEAYAVTISEEDMRAARSLARLADVVARGLNR